MQVNRKLLPLKLHFFVFWGCISSVLPFMMVVARQLGVPVATQGIISAVITATAVLVKPAISAIADYLPACRKPIFLLLLTTMILTIGPIGFFSPLYGSPTLRGKLEYSAGGGAMNFLANYSGECYFTVAWDCAATSDHPDTRHPHATGLKLTHIPTQDKLEMPPQQRGANTSSGEMLETPRYQGTTLLRGPRTNQVQKSEDDDDDDDETLTREGALVYLVEGFLPPEPKEMLNVSLVCGGGEVCWGACPPPWTLPCFWLYVLLLLVGQVVASTVESISDAICCDTIGVDGDYGRQRVWGAVSYGLLGVGSGLLVDWWSGDKTTKNYTPAFLLTVACGVLDILISATCLKVPRLKDGTEVWKELKPLLHQIHFLVFLSLAFLVGFYDGLDTGYVFVLQEDMATGRAVMQHMKFIQGLTMLVQALSCIPFMFLCDWFVKKLGSHRVIALVLFLYAIRLAGLALASNQGLVWATVMIELINGPCFGLGFTAVVVHASSITPKGTSNTVQSVVSVCYGTLGYAGASFVGGIIYEWWGGEMLYLATSVLAAITCLLHLVYIKFYPHIPEAKELGLEAVGEQDLKILLERKAAEAAAATTTTTTHTTIIGRDLEEQDQCGVEREALLQDIGSKILVTGSVEKVEMTLEELRSKGKEEGREGEV
ncbi:major facilitator superfamily domain-containing protein 6 isoform X1 [Procambarus clarkii]|uniref:major facilitator superfamily domain-containing protein 6 isoform X1 n=2 Tax=Procambarus clarkii TaxID=6728 RepID=UPI0037429520